jgi:hypothetical protein
VLHINPGLRGSAISQHGWQIAASLEGDVRDGFAAALLAESAESAGRALETATREYNAMLQIVGGTSIICSVHSQQLLALQLSKSGAVDCEDLC